LLQQDRLTWLAEQCRAQGRRVEIETNGTVVPSQRLLDAAYAFNVSPKLANSQIPRARRIRPEPLAAFARSDKAAFKFVVNGVADLEEVGKLAAEFGLAPIWIMPQATTVERVLTVMQQVADDVLARGWSLTPRLHILLWGDVRGR
jgi:organic radical activating enzyme